MKTIFLNKTPESVFVSADFCGMALGKTLDPGQYNDNLAGRRCPIAAIIRFNSDDEDDENPVTLHLEAGDTMPSIGNPIKREEEEPRPFGV